METQHRSNLPTIFGQGIGRLVASGTVRIIRNAADWCDLPDKPVIVVVATNSAMLPSMNGIKGIIAEQPGLTSHAALVGRELGIATVCNVPGATRLFMNGQIVTVDGPGGKIIVGEPESDFDRNQS